MKQQTQTDKIEWQEEKLGVICDVRDGTHASPKYVQEGYPLITSKNLTKGFIDFSEINLISKSDFDEVNKRSKVDSGDIIMPMIGTIGNPVIVQKNIREFAIKNVALIKLKNSDISNIYIKFILDSSYFDKVTAKYNRGGTQKFIALGDIRNIPIPLPFLPNGKPDLKEQEKIVKILEKAEKIKEKGENAERLLDDYLKSVFNEMFLKKGFDLKKGRELFELVYGKGLSSEQRDGGKYPVYGSNGVVGSHSEFLVKGPGIIIGRKGSIGEVNYSQKKFWAIDTTYYVKPLKEINFVYLYYLLKTYNLKLNNSTAIPGLNRNDVYAIRFIDSPLLPQQKFARIVEQVERLKENIKKIKLNSEELFNSLIQKAFRGEL